MEDNLAHCKNIGFYSDKNVKFLEDFEQRNDRIWLTF